jgi:hypothetical protein
MPSAVTGAINDAKADTAAVRNVAEKLFVIVVFTFVELFSLDYCALADS